MKLIYKYFSHKCFIILCIFSTLLCFINSNKKTLAINSKNKLKKLYLRSNNNKTNNTNHIIQPKIISSHNKKVFLYSLDNKQLPVFYNNYLQIENSFTILEKCNSTNCHMPYGICKNETICQCDFKYANIDLNSELSKSIACLYQRKKRIIAILFEIILPLGSSHFYIGEYSIGFLKLTLLLFIPLVLLFILCYYGRSEKRTLTGKIYILLFNTFLFFYLIAVSLWLLIDIVKISLNEYRDKNGIELAPWL
jgi:hypothetical protein